MRRLLALALAPVLALSGPAVPQEAVLSLPPGTSEDLRTVLENASLTLSLDREGLDEVADYVGAARADYRRLLTGLYAEGYYGGVVSITVDGREASTIQPLEAPAAVSRVVLSVDPGPRFTFGTAAVGPLAPATELPLGFAPGEVARSETIREAVRAAVAAWRDEGHALAAVASQETVAAHPGDRLDVAVTIAAGPRLTFGEVTASGNVAVRTARVLRIAGIPEGDVFSPLALERAAERLRRTGAFDSVALVEAESAGPGATLPVAIQVTEALPRRLGFAAEISSLDGLSASAFWLHRNLLGGAERLRVEAEVSNIGGEDLGAEGGTDYALGLSFGRPATFSADNDLFIEARIEEENAEDYALSQFTLDVGITRFVSEGVTASAALGLLVSEEETAVESRDFTLLTLPLGGTADRRDDPRDARAGFYLGLEATPFVGVSGDTGAGARLYADARAYRTLGRITLAGRTQLGSVYGPDRADVPQDFLFFSGGGGSVRGQEFQSLGVEVPDPDAPGETVTLGGAGFAGLQAEARVRVTERIGVVAFADAGFVGADPLGGEGEWQGGLGLGGRYSTVVGPIRVDLATPATGDAAFEEVQLYIGIGHSF
jgi:translocation and assembly module TamA